MATLTEVAYYARKSVIFSVVGLIGYIVLQAVFQFSIKLYRELNPEPPPAPTMGFGLLPKLYFAKQEDGYNFKFLLQTPDGKFPTFSDRATVYYVPYKKATLFAYDEAEQLAQLFRFTDTGQKINDTTYVWQKRIPQLLSMKVNIVSQTYSYSYQWASDTSLLSDKQNLTEDSVYQIASNFIQKNNASISDISFAKGTVSYLRAQGENMIPAVSLSEADFVKVDYFRNDIDDIPVVTYKPDTGIITLVVSKSSQYDKQVVSAEYNYYPINYLQPETYPLTPIASAWEMLKAGQAYIASNNTNSEEVTIRRIYLAYFDPPIAQEFFQPVYVFEGDNDFVAYVSAVADSAIKN